MESVRTDNNDRDSNGEQAMSLCDLSGAILNENQSRNKVILASEAEDFEFGSWVCPHLSTSEMSAADDLFFQGKILPLRSSVSSDNGLIFSHSSTFHKQATCESRSDSMERFSVSENLGLDNVRRNYSHSSSSSSGRSISSSSLCTQLDYKFHTHPTPKPHMTSDRRTAKSVRNELRPTGWGLLRLSLVKTPDILALEDLRYRRRKTKVDSSNANKNSDVFDVEMEKKKQKHRTFYNSLNLNCKRYVDAIEPGYSRIDPLTREKDTTSKSKKKQSFSRHRTFEWLKELSISEITDV